MLRGLKRSKSPKCHAGRIVEKVLFHHDGLRSYKPLKKISVSSKGSSQTTQWKSEILCYASCSDFLVGASKLLNKQSDELNVAQGENFELKIRVAHLQKLLTGINVMAASKLGRLESPLIAGYELKGGCSSSTSKGQI
ncbi:hypothetical protein Ancab_028953 [Ancistrocladus abbreviatus]